MPVTKRPLFPGFTKTERSLLARSAKGRGGTIEVPRFPFRPQESPIVQAVRRRAIGEQEERQSPRTVQEYYSGEQGHVVLVPTMNRPRKLAKLISSIHENVRKFNYRKPITVVVVDDSSENEANQNRKKMSQFMEKSPSNVRIQYYNRADQQQLLSEMAQRGGGDVQKFIYEHESKKGYGGVRNMALLFGVRHSNPNDIVTFLDDDVTLKNLVVEERHGKRSLRIRHVSDYFGNIDRMFSRPGVDVAGGGYTIDNHFGEFNNIQIGIRAIEHFFAQAREHRPDEVCDNTFKEIWGQSPSRGTKYREGLELVEKLTRDMIAGKQRFNLGMFNPNMYHTPYLAGGNLSMRARIMTEIPYPLMAGTRGEDIVFTALAYFRGKHPVWFYPNPVSHRKDSLDTSIGGGQRNVFRHAALEAAPFGIIGTMKALSYRGNLVKRLRSNHPEMHSLLQDEIAGQEKWIDQEYVSDFERRLQNIRKYLDTEAWYNEGKERQVKERIGKMVDYIEDEVKKLRHKTSEVLRDQRLTKVLEEYPHRMDRWRELVEIAKYSRLQQAA